MVRKRKILVPAVLGLAAAFVTAGFVPVSHPALTRAVVRTAWQSGAGPCSIGDVKAAFWQGVTLKRVSCTFPLGSGRRCAVKADAIVLRCNLVLAFVASRVIRPRSGREAPFARDPFAVFRHLDRASGRTLTGASVPSADVVVTGKKQATVALRGCSLTVRCSKNGCRGSFAADSLRCSGVPTASRLRGDFSTGGDLFILSGLTGTSFGGSLRCDGRADFSHRSVGTLSFSISDFDIDEWYRYADTAAGRLSGIASLRVTLDSSVMALDSLRGRGTAAASRLSVSRFAFQRTLADVLGYPPLNNVRFVKAAAVFTIAPGGIFSTEASGHNDSLAVTTTGRFRTDGMLDQNVECTVAPRAVRSLPKFARQTLEVTRDGGRVLRLRVHGAFDNPKISIASTVILQNAVKNMFNDVRDNIRKWLQ
jgi:hypothetical protein